MKKPPKYLKVGSVRYLRDYKLKIIFSDGCEQEVDFGPFLKGSLHPEIKKYLDPTRFKTFHVRGGELMWGDFDLVFPIMDLYHNTLVRFDQTVG